MVNPMDTPLNASSTTAGALMSGARFQVPQFQREYAWEREEVEEFFSDLQRGLTEDSYFLGLIVLTGPGLPKDIVDGQQRLLTLTLLASAVFHQAVEYDRRALAERIQSTFLRSIDFDSDEELPRMRLSGAADDATLQRILESPASDLSHLDRADESVSSMLLSAYTLLTGCLVDDLGSDAFKRLGLWADFLTNKLYMAVFVHPDPASAYKVFEVVNTRGRELTTADLLKSYVLSQTPERDRERRYAEWQALATAFPVDNPNTFVQFIRHAVTTARGHVLPKDLYDVLAGRTSASRGGMSPDELIDLLQASLPAYSQMMDPTAEGPASEEQLAVFSVLNRLNVIAVRPILLAMLNAADTTTGMASLLKLVVRRVVVGNLGTGNVERRLGQAAQRIAQDRHWEKSLEQLDDLNPEREEFQSQLHHRSMNRNVLSVIRQSVVQETITPEPIGYLYLIRPRSAWPETSTDRAAYWVSTIGNTFLSNETRRPTGTATWEGFKERLLPDAVNGELVALLESYETWDVDTIKAVGNEIANRAADVWY